MDLVFRDEIHIDPTTDDAVVWADTSDNQHFRVVFERKYVEDVLKAETPRSRRYAAAIKRQLPAILPHANAALKQGYTGIIL